MEGWNKTWSESMPVGRSLHTAVWTGTEMIVWGGVISGASTEISTYTGERYFPSTDSWQRISTGAYCPSARYGHTAVWTGTEMIVWGGDRNAGGRYNPATDSWTPTSHDLGFPFERSLHTAVWTGTEMIIWGGGDEKSATKSGAAYDPIDDDWHSLSYNLPCPSERKGHYAVWTGTEMIVWGGTNTLDLPLNDGGRYDPCGNSWASLSKFPSKYAGCSWQDIIKVQVLPEIIKSLPGVPVDVDIRITNTGDKDIWIATNLQGLSDNNKFEKMRFERNNGETFGFPPVTGDQYTRPPRLIDDTNFEKKTIIKAGESIQWQSEFNAGNECPVSHDLTGKWKGDIKVKLPIAEGDSARDIKETVVVGDFVIEFQKLEGEDLAYFNAVKEWMSKTDPSQLINGFSTFLGEGSSRENVRPLTWGELLGSLRMPVERIFLDKYPISTYAGYILLKIGPPGSLEDASKVTPEKFDRQFNVVGTREEKEKRRTGIKQYYADYIKKVRAFLAVQPDTSIEARLRNKIVVALFYTDKPKKAWREVEVLSKMDCSRAKEAKELLMERKKLLVDSPPKEKATPPKEDTNLK